MDNVTCYIDDLLITGKAKQEHLNNMLEVLHRLCKHEVRLRHEKCHFMKEGVEYLGHQVDAKGIHATDSKLKTITEVLSRPKNHQELRAFLVILYYYGRFIPNRAKPLQ